MRFRVPHALILALVSVGVLLLLICCAGNLESLFQKSPENSNETIEPSNDSQQMQKTVGEFMGAVHDGRFKSAYDLFDRQFTSKVGF
ncbi:MAG TPA: hypothetical protein VGX70_12710, partial [Gemmataceae bacterium]|nr:hypothetical protein [Gemmataceae bacterium]